MRRAPLHPVVRPETLSLVARLQRVAYAAREYATERGLHCDEPHLEPLTDTERELVEALDRLGRSAP